MLTGIMCLRKLFIRECSVEQHDKVLHMVAVTLLDELNN
jgi:hypothetical protein